MIQKGNGEFINLENFEKFENNDITCLYSKFVIYNKLLAGEQSIAQLVEDFFNDKLNFDNLLGSFKIFLYNRKTNTSTFFCDNSGSLSLYFDQKSNFVSDSFLELLENKKDNQPNYKIISQFLQFGCVYSYETICVDVESTDSDCYYVIEKNKIIKHSKNLTDLKNLKNYRSLNEIINTMVNSTKHLKTSAVITGGMDSRAILANLIALKQKPDLFISGKSDDADVVIAKEIARVTKLTLTSTNELHEKENWIEDAFTACDGVTGTFSRVRLYNKGKVLKDNGYDLEFGGVAGEFYKNSFINQDFPFYSGEANVDKFYDLKIASYNFPKYLCGENILPHINDMKQTVINQLNKFKCDNKFKTYTNMGRFLLTKRIQVISNSSALYLSAASPLLERDTIALIYNMNPKKLEMQRFQRNETTKHCPSIAKIKTDRGLTCSSENFDVFRDFIKNYLGLVKIAINRLFKRNKVSGRTDLALLDGLKSKQYYNAIEKCTEFNILSKGIDIEKIPAVIGDRLMTVGTVLLRHF